MPAATQKKHIKPEDFIIAYQRGKSHADVAAKLGTTECNVRTRASKYRKLGIPLQKFPRNHGTPLDIAALTKLAQDHAPKED